MEVRSLPLSSGTAFLLRDVTEQERSERQIRRRERRVAAANRSLRLAHKAARAASWEWRPGHALRWLDLAAARALVGRPAEWTQGDELADWRSLVPAEDEPAIEAGFRQVREAGEATFRFRVAGPDGELHWLEASAAVTQRGADGAPTLVSGVTVNIDAAKAAEAHQLMLIDELNHRVKNMLATVQSVARQSLTAAAPIAARNFEERLLALAWTYEVLTDAQWVGAKLDEVLSRTLSPHARTSDRRLILVGPVVLLTPNQALAIAMAAHELATNAVKYGALAGASGGRVEIDWRVEQGRLQLTWREVGGPPVTPPQRRGFGSRLVERALARELGGTATLSFPVEGLVCYLNAPLGAD